MNNLPPQSFLQNKPAFSSGNKQHKVKVIFGIISLSLAAGVIYGVLIFIQLIPPPFKTASFPNPLNSIFKKAPVATNSQNTPISSSISGHPKSQRLTSDLYPYDPISPMVKVLKMDYIIFGTISKVEKKSSNSWLITFSDLKTNSFLEIEVNIDNKPLILGANKKPLTLDKILPGRTATISLTIDKKENLQKVLSIDVNQ